MYELNLSITQYIGVHGFVQLSNRKCDLGRFPFDSVLGPPGNILLFLRPYPLEFSASGTPPSKIFNDFSWGAWIFSGAIQFSKVIFLEGAISTNGVLKEEMQSILAST